MTQINSNNLSSRTALGGDGGSRDMQSGSHGVTQYYAEPIPLPAKTSRLAHLAPSSASFYCRAIELLKALNVAQALRDVLLALGVLFGLLAVLGAIPLAFGMMLFVYFQ